MSYRIEITDTAQRDLESIYEHIAFTLCVPDNVGGQCPLTVLDIALRDRKVTAAA